MCHYRLMHRNKPKRIVIGYSITASERRHCEVERARGLEVDDQWLLRECRSGWQLLVPTLSLSLDLVESRQRPFKFVIEEPHRIENFAEACRCFCPVGLPKGEDAVVAQISHNRRVGNSMVGQ